MSQPSLPVGITGCCCRDYGADFPGKIGNWVLLVREGSRRAFSDAFRSIPHLTALPGSMIPAEWD